MEESVLHNKATRIAKQLMGEDMAFDFDMLLNKACNFISVFDSLKSSYAMYKV